MVETHKHRFQGPAASTVQLLTDLPEGELAGETLGCSIQILCPDLILKESVLPNIFYEWRSELQSSSFRRS